MLLTVGLLQCVCVNINSHIPEIKILFAYGLGVCTKLPA